MVIYSLARLGRLDEVTRLLSPGRAGAAIPAPGEPWEQWALFAVGATALVWAGRLREAGDLFTRAQGAVIDQPAAEASAYVAGWLAVLHLEQGRPVSAFRRASESYTLFRQLGRTFSAPWPYTAAVQALAVAGQAGRAAETLAAGASEALGKVAGDVEDLGTILYAAEASAEAAVLLRQAGQTRRAAAAGQRAARLLARCEGAATPPVRFITARVRLTQGELDTAMQAAAGRANKHIAAGMQLSVRTVESHLPRAYEQLGISRRHVLAAAPPPPPP